MLSIITSQHREKACAARDLVRSFRLLPKADLELRVAALHSGVTSQGIPGQTFPGLHNMPESKAPTHAFCYAQQLCSWDHYMCLQETIGLNRIKGAQAVLWIATEGMRFSCRSAVRTDRLQFRRACPGCPRSPCTQASPSDFSLSRPRMLDADICRQS